MKNDFVKNCSSLLKIIKGVNFFFKDPETGELNTSKEHLKSIFCQINKKNRFIENIDDMTISIEGIYVKSDL